MSETVIVALIAACVPLIGVIYSAKKSNDNMLSALDKHSELNDQKLADQLDKFQAVTDAKIDGLRQEVEKHNSLVERTYSLEMTVTLHGERLNNLEKKQG